MLQRKHARFVILGQLHFASKSNWHTCAQHTLGHGLKWQLGGGFFTWDRVLDKKKDSPNKCMHESKLRLFSFSHSFPLIQHNSWTFRHRLCMCSFNSTHSVPNLKWNQHDHWIEKQQKWSKWDQHEYEGSEPISLVGKTNGIHGGEGLGSPNIVMTYDHGIAMDWKWLNGMTRYHQDEGDEELISEHSLSSLIVTNDVEWQQHQNCDMMWL